MADRIPFGHPSTLGPKPFRPVTVMFVESDGEHLDGDPVAHECATVEEIVKALDLSDGAGLGPDIDQFRTDDIVFACYDPYWARMTGGKRALIVSHSRKALAKSRREAWSSQ